MSIISVQTVQTGLVGVLPSLAYINTSDTIAEVTTAGYLNKEVANGTSFQMPCLAVVATKSTPTSASTVGTYYVTHSGENWSLTLNGADQINLPSAEIIVGNAGGIGTAVAMSGDIAIDNTGATTIEDDAVTLAKLAAGIAPYGIIKYCQLEATLGGSAGEQFFVPGLVGTDLVFTQMKNNGPNNVTILEALSGTELLTVTFSGDPGAGAQFYYLVVRLAT